MDSLSEVSTLKSPIPSLHISELREFIREKEREARIPYKAIKSINNLFAIKGN
jgi:hypothetical protein